MEGHHPKRCPLKTRPPKWKEKLREICLSRVREDRSQLLHKFRLSSKSAINSKETAVFALEQIVSEELIKVRNSSDGDIKNVILSDKDDAIWDYEPSQSVKKLDNVEYQEILLEMQRLLYDDIEVELKQRDLLEDYEKACALEDESLAAAFSEHMKIHEEQLTGSPCWKDMHQWTSCNDTLKINKNIESYNEWWASVPNMQERVFKATVTVDLL
ncbi:uncharacterized protein LOC131036657 isoform X5 [Cryptomeria japonica]|uniref:uncharacterized protein LOC131036657 isoform X5 n=1 Tax=Cryptomeria japonica TaxID=3369 RepID=UPI0025AC5EF8|nr:uncharacterized protein LOC131036657 isoform X5 [Cryptomeria japonica]